MKRVLTLLAFALLIIFLFSALVGRYPAPGFLPLQRITEDELAQRLPFNLRLPRLLTALLLSMTLSAAGMVFQLLFSNPLVEPGFLGVSQGAAFGAAFSIVFLGGAAIVTQTSASVFALAGLGISYLLAHRLRYGGWVLRLVLAGIAVSALFSAGLDLLKYLVEHGVNKNVVVVGHFPFIDRLKPISKNLWVLELNPQEGDLPAQTASEVVPQADVVAITITTLINKTFQGLIDLCQPEARVILVGPSTPLSPVMYDYGIDILSGTIVTDPQTVLTGVGQGISFHQLRQKRS